MYIDKELEFSDAQTVAAGPSTNVIDLGASRDVGIGRDLFFTTAIDADVTGTLVATLQASDDEAFGSGVVTVATHTFDAAATAGSRIISKLPPKRAKARYFRVLYSGGTAGQVSAFINNDVEAYEEYPSAYTV